MSEYWFARRYPATSGRNSVGPVSSEGRMAFIIFAGSMMTGALAWGLMSFLSLFFSGLFVFIVATVAAVIRLFRQVRDHTDMDHTMDDYRAGRVGQV